VGKNHRMGASCIDRAARSAGGPVGFFARLARDLVRWARRRRSTEPPPAAEVHPPGSSTTVEARSDSGAAGVPPPRVATRARPPLVGEAVPCVVGEPFAEWLLTRRDHKTPTRPERAGTPIAAERRSSSGRQLAQACKGADTNGHRVRGDRAPAEPIPAATPAVWSVSVVLVATGRPDGLRRPVGSVLDQSYSDWELLVVETGEAPPPHVSTPDPRIRVVNAPGATVAYGARRGIEAATGEVIAHLDERSLMAPHWLAEVVASLVAAPADVVIGAAELGDDEQAGGGPTSGLAHHRHVPLAVVERLLTAGALDVFGLAPGISVRRLQVPAAVFLLDPQGLALPGSRAHPVIDLTTAAAAPLALAGL
jgi:hypothetical protein